MTGKGLGNLFDHLIIGPTVRELTPEYLSPVRIYAPPIGINEPMARVTAGEYVRTELEAEVDKPTITGDAVKHYRKHAHKRPAIAFCVSVAHAHHTRDIFSAAGYSAAVVDGKMDVRERDRMISDLATGQCDVLCSCDVISEGLDVPRVEVGIMLRPTKSLTLCRQQQGRILRRSPGKDYAILLDHAGNVFRHGRPDSPDEWSLDKGVESRKQMDAEDRVRQCDLCYFVHSWAPACPQCGYIYIAKEREIQHIEADLQLLEEDKERWNKALERKKAKGIEELLALAKARGYKTGWAYAIYNARQAKENDRNEKKQQAAQARCVGLF
jgi:superfamily II DNA or RNA helicase